MTPAARSTLCIVPAVLSALLIVAALVLRGRLEDARDRVSTLEARIESLEAEAAARESQGPPEALPAALPGLTAREAERLRALGLENPEADLRADLMKHPELIPQEGVLGGTMGFYFPERIWILTGRWAFAYFEDGHRAGYILLRYDVSRGGAVSWEVIRSYLD